MNKRIIIIILVLVLIIVIGGYFYMKKEKVEITNIKYFEYYHSAGMMMNSDERLILEKKDNSYQITIKKVNEPPESAITKKVTNSFAEILESILKKYNVEKWDGFNKSDPNVLDGSSFSITINMMDGNHISAHGYMMYPKDYGKVVKEIEELFEETNNNQS
jgi:hypothetical protein